MGAYTSIRGWVEVHDKALADIRNVLVRHEDQATEFELTREGAEFYNKGWIIPNEHINWTHYIFYGADIRTRAIPFIRSEMAEIAAMFMRDDEIDDDWGIFPTGVIHVEEDGTHGYPDEEWLLQDGKLIRNQIQRE
ncbi:hypothetical protein [uncultured Rubinisphaera sp.]|uniref:hypothetical protein n=1 Tax=uncultured Rubinisphaera sp. TaxID=1678686 RepID=UPI0030DBE6C5|tara:strand:+ start:714 stop:1121 length:408 start_codon:yes stop_codon:yes gene_type:complete